MPNWRATVTLMGRWDPPPRSWKPGISTWGRRTRPSGRRALLPTCEVTQRRSIPAPRASISCAMPLHRCLTFRRSACAWCTWKPPAATGTTAPTIVPRTQLCFRRRWAHRSGCSGCARMSSRGSRRGRKCSRTCEEGSMRKATPWPGITRSGRRRTSPGRTDTKGICWRANSSILPRPFRHSAWSAVTAMRRTTTRCPMSGWPSTGRKRLHSGRPLCAASGRWPMSLPTSASWTSWRQRQEPTRLSSACAIWLTRAR